MYRTGLHLCKAKASWQRSAAIFLPTRTKAFRTCAAHNEKRSTSLLDDLPLAEFGEPLARVDSRPVMKHPHDDELLTNNLVQGIGGRRHKRTLTSFSLEGKVGVVTGGARGLGSAMSQALISSGTDLAIVDLHLQEAEYQAAQLLETFRKEHANGTRPPKITAHYADVSDPSSVNSAVVNIVQQHGKIDSLITSAGFCENIEAINYPPEKLRKLWCVNVDGTYFFAVAVAKHLMERKSTGSMVFIGSMSGNIVNMPQPQAPYNASKAAVRHLAASLAVEWAALGIRVNCVSPGYMLTALTERILDENPAIRKQWTALVPQGRIGKPQDIIGAVTFLLSEASSYVTGSDMRVDGGYTLT